MRSRLTTRCWLFAACTALAAGCAAADAKPQPPAEKPVEVAVVEVQSEAVALSTELAGRTSAFVTAEVRPQVTGIIKSREFKEGATVTAGQLLYVIEPSVYKATFERARAELTSAEALVLTTRVRAERYAELVKINAVSKQEHDDARATHLSSVAAVEQARASMQSARINLDYTRVVAPIGGRIGRSSVTQGALVTAGQATALATIAQLDPIYVDVTQSSVQLLQLKRLLSSGGMQPASTKVRLKLEDGSDYVQAGELQFTDVTVDASTGSVTLRALFPNPEGLLLPGMYVRALLDEALDPHAIMAPQQAVTRDEKGQASVLVVDQSNKVHVRSLTTGRAIGDRWQVLSGLAPGERVVVEGNDKIKPGAQVTPVPKAPLAPVGG